MQPTRLNIILLEKYTKRNRTSNVVFVELQTIEFFILFFWVIRLLGNYHLLNFSGIILTKI